MAVHAYSSSPMEMPFFDTWNISTDLFPDLCSDLSSIYADVRKLESLDMDICDSTLHSDSSSCGDNEHTPKAEIRNGDCMWSSGQLSTSASSTNSEILNAVPPAAVTDSKKAPIVVMADNSKLRQAQKMPQQQYIATKPLEIKLEPSDDYEQQLQQHSIPNSKGAQPQPKNAAAEQGQSMQNIPPGTSLLRRSNVSQQQKRLPQKPQLALTKIEPTSCDNTSYPRPDTPRSLDDEATTDSKFRVDLGACIVGSNNIALTTDASSFIDNVSQELQDTSKDHINTRLAHTNYGLHDVLEVIKDEFASNSSVASSMTHSADSETEDEDSGPDAELYGRISPVSSQMSSEGSSSQQNSLSYYHINDHSYTRSNDGTADIIDTPSDSDEEIDVVSIGDKKLPTYPSDKDRRAIQTKVASKFSNARIVKTANGVRTIPPRHRYNMPYTPASNSPVKSVATSRYPSPTSTPYQTVSYGNGKYTPINVISEKSRKRVTAAAAADIIGDVESSVWPPSKKHRGKKLKHHGSITTLGSAGMLKRHNTIDELDTIEKRNLHNDMERQRRIGLKNLFEELKKQIPSIRDKERAPKVNILREAAKLCEALTREDQQLSEQKAMLKEVMRKRQEQLARLRSLQRD